MRRARLDALGLVLAAAALLLWLWRDDAAWAATSRLPMFGYPLLSLWIRAAALLVVAAAAFRLRVAFAAAGGALLKALDAADQRLARLPKRRGLAMRALGVGLGVGATLVALGTWTQAGDALETRAIDLFYRLRFPERSQVELATGRELPSAKRQPDVVVIALDDETIAHLGWPLPRIDYARLIDAVGEVRPESLTFDVSLIDRGRDHPEWDSAIGEAARRAGNVAFSFTVASITGDTRPSFSEAALRALDASSIAWHPSAAALPEYSEIVGGDAAPQPVIDPVAAAADSIAMANVLLDGGDDVLRHSLLVARLRERLLPSLSLRVAARALHVPLEQVRVYPGSHVDLGGARAIPIDHLGRTLVRYQGRYDPHGDGPFRYLSLWSVLRTDSTVTLVGNPLGDDQRFKLDEQTHVTRAGTAISLGELDGASLGPGAWVTGKARYSPDPGRVLELELSDKARGSAEPDFEMLDEQTLKFTTRLGTLRHNRADLSSLAGKHVMVGSTALAAADMRHSPLGEMPGVEHHATMLANLLHGDFFYQAPEWVTGVTVMAAAVSAAVIGVALPAGAGLVLTALLALALMTGAFLLSSSGIQVAVVAPTAAVGLTHLLCLLMGTRSAKNAHARAEKEREFVRQTFGRYLTEQVVQKLLDSPDGLRLGGQRDFVTIMMTDLRGFTSMCGTMEPEDVVRLLNHYLEVMTQIITRYGGTIDEFIGDAILVVFGAPLPLEKAELKAVACAIEMLNAMPEVNRWNEGHRLPSVEMGIGIHSGEVVLGNIGSELRAKYGIVGATINLTSRVESFTVGGQVLISEATRERCGEAVAIGATQVVSPKGVKGTLSIHEALGVGAPFEVKLHGAHEQLVPPRQALSLRYAAVKNKQVEGLTRLARVERLSEFGFELQVDEELPALTDLQLRVLDGDGVRPGELYGKVLRRVGPSVVYLRLTSVPSELQGLLAAARGASLPEPKLVLDSVQVST
jgi:class 3 adenylate cyclase/CHASE2 domain-containing sensor protein